MKVVVITGSTRGIGFGLAASFLDLGCDVVISGRSDASVRPALTELLGRSAPERILGQPCDVTQPEQLQELWNQAIERFGKVDIWINNAGIATDLRDFWDVAPEEASAVVDTNLLGSMYGARVALKGMLAQGYGALYNMEGLGSNGRKQEGMTVYGTTKAAIRYFTEALIVETKDTSILVGSLSPGMVSTSFVTDRFVDRPELWQASKGVLKIIMDDVETVTPWLAQRVMENEEHGARINWLTRRKLAGRFLTASLGRRKGLGDLDEYRASRSRPPQEQKNPVDP